MIVDDFTISGGTLITLANRLKELGAGKIIACTSHLLVSEKGIKRINESPIERLISTDTVYNPSAELSEKISVVSAAPLFAEAIFRIHNHESISSLISKLPEGVRDFASKYKC